MVQWYQTNVIETGRSAALFLLVGFLVTYGITRWLTLTIRARKGDPNSAGPVKDVFIGGVHIHHQVWGILLILVTGLLEFRFQPEAPWQEVLAALFGAGAALALDEFALWLYLDDVYWTDEGRKSIDAVMVAAVVGLALLVGTSPIGVDRSDVNTLGVVLTAVAVFLHVAYTIICLLKGKIATGLIGLPVPFVSVVGAVRLAEPSSFWARRFYSPDKMGRATIRHQLFLRRRDSLRDLLGGKES